MAFVTRNPLLAILAAGGSVVLLGLLLWLVSGAGGPVSLPLSGAVLATAGVAAAALKRPGRDDPAVSTPPKAPEEGARTRVDEAEREERPPEASAPAAVDRGVRDRMDARAVRELAGRVRSLADHLERVAVQASTRAAAGSEHAVALASAMQQLSAAIAVVGENSSRSARAAEEVVAASGRLAAALDVLRESADAIAGIVDTVREVAEKTRMLALNAAIEAARVGEAGRGFAVVAGEVKALARRTAEATAGIEDRIAAMQEAFAQAGEVARAVDANARTASGAAAAIAAAVEEQSAVTAAISGQVRAIAAASEELARLLGAGTGDEEGLFALARRLEADAQQLEERTTATIGAAGKRCPDGRQEAAAA